MQVFCPSCGAGSEVGPGVASASCARCGAALPVNMPAFGPPEMGPKPQAFGVEDMAAAAGTVRQPPTTFTWSEAQSPDGAWLVRTRGTAPGCAFVLGIAFLGATVFASSQCASPRGGGEVRGVLLGLVAVWLAYKALCAAVNRSTLRLDGDWLTVRRGPVPELGGVRIPTSSISGFDLIHGMRSSSTEKQTAFRIVRALGVGPPTRLPLGVLPREQGDFVRGRLTEMLADVQRRFGVAPPPTYPGSPPF